MPRTIVTFTEDCIPLDHETLLRALKDEDGTTLEIFVNYEVGEWRHCDSVEMNEDAIRDFIKDKNGQKIEIVIDWELSGHMYRGSVHETATDCGNCGGTRCDDEFDRNTGQQIQWACRKVYSYWANLK